VWIAAPLEAEGFLVLAGHVERGDAATRVNVEQVGKVLCEVPATPGFCFKVPLRHGLYLMSLWHKEDRLRQWEILPAERVVAARDGMATPYEACSTLTPKGQPYATRGRMGDLFLAGDSNDSVGQFTENRGLSPNATAAWENVFCRFPVWRQEFGLAQVSLLIAPAKEEIRREYYPFARAKRTVLDDFMSRFGGSGVTLPKWELWHRRDLAWSCTDTHWTDYGATVAAGAVLRAWGLPTTNLPESFRVRQRIGDLGNKVNPQVSSYELAFLSEVGARLVFDNGITNQGNIRVFRNPAAPQPKTLLIFGDSFGTNLAQAFSGVFSMVTYAYQPAGFDPLLTEAVKPEYVLLQITQRFLHGHPATGKSVFAMANRKLSEMSTQLRDDLLNRLSSAPSDFHKFTTPLFLDSPMPKNTIT
jgi:hypothetical protein